MNKHFLPTRNTQTKGMAMNARTFATIAAAVAVLLSASCANDVDDINRVQPNYIKKKDLLGKEFYMQSMVTKTQITSAYTFPGSASSTVRGVFEFHESSLYFYRTYEFIAGSEVYAAKSDADTPMKDKDGNVLHRAVLQDFMSVPCTQENGKDVCFEGHWCANAAKPQVDGEGEYHGRCVTKGVRYIYRGAPVMAWPTTHFDIQRGYSAATGEQSNVISENTTDREWHEREYARVSWGSNVGMSFEADVMARILFGSNPNGNIYEGDGAPAGEGFEMGTDHRFGKDVPQTYITYSNRMIATAPQIYLASWGGGVPLCFFYPWYSGGVYDCITEEIGVRYFFLQVPPFKDGDDRKYVARDMDDVEFEKFGYFRTERKTYNQEYSQTFSGAIRRAQRHRIWDRYAKKMVADKDGNETWEGEFDYSKMSPTPIVYYLNEDHPRELVQAATRMAQAWSKPYEEVVAFHKGGCGAKKEKAAYDQCMKDSWPSHPMFVLCENSDAQARAAKAAGWTYKDGHVGEYSDTEVGKKFCRNMGEVHKFGDLRYSTMHAVPNPIQIGLYGYGPSATDPLTGETLAGYAHSYVAAMKRGAEAAMRTIEYNAGIKDFNDIKRRSEQKFLTKAKALKRYSNSGPASTKAAQAYVAKMMDSKVRSRMMSQGLMRSDSAGTWAAGRMDMLRQNKVLEAKLLAGDDTGWAHALFKDPRVNAKGVPTDDDTMAQYSMATWAHIAGQNNREKVKRELMKENIYLAEFADTAVLNLAKEYGGRFDEGFCKAYATTETQTTFDWDKLLSETDGKHKGDCDTAGKYEALGEIGLGRVCANVGGKTQWVGCSSQILMQKLRVEVNDARGGSPFAEPNKFLPSPLYTDTNDGIVTATQQIGRKVVDAIRPAVKQELWSRIYEGTQLHEIGHTLGLRHNFEASTDALNFHKEYWGLKLEKGEVANPWQPDTAKQSLGGIREKMLASVMDYTAKFNGRFAGLGLYDGAAIKFAYGDMVEVFDKAPDLTKAPNAKLPAAQKYLEEPSDTDPIADEVQHLGNTSVNRLTRKLHYSTLPAYLGGVDAMYSRRNVDWKLFKGKTCKENSDCGVAGACEKFGAEKYCTTLDEVEVPYRFCSDEYNRRTPTCSTWDEGADQLEIARNYLDNYENYWFFYGYGEDSVTFHPNNYSGRVYSYFSGARRQLEWFAVQFDQYMKGDWWTKKYGVSYDQDPNGGLSGALASALTTNRLGQVVGRPAPGYYCYNSLRKRFEPYDDREQSSLTDCQIVLETDGARRLYGGWDFGGYLGRPVSGGQIYDRLWAFVLLSDPTPQLYFKVNQQEDDRRYLVSPFTMFPKKILNLLSGVGTENSDHYGWCVVNGGGGSNADKLIPRHWVGGTGEACPAQCEDFAKKPADQQVGCRKYFLFPDARPTFPSSRFRMPLLGNLYGMAMTNRGYDRSYMDVSRIFLKGHHTQIDLPNATTVCEFTDPLSGKVYISPKTSDDVLNPGCMNIEAAQQALDQFGTNLKNLQDNYLFSEYQFRVSLLEVLRAMHETYEF